MKLKDSAHTNFTVVKSTRAWLICSKSLLSPDKADYSIIGYCSMIV